MFLEIGTDRDHVHFLIQSVPSPCPVGADAQPDADRPHGQDEIKSITAKEVFRRVPSVRRVLWSGAFWSSGYSINTVGRNGTEETIRRYVQEQGREPEYRRLHAQQLGLFE